MKTIFSTLATVLLGSMSLAQTAPATCTDQQTMGAAPNYCMLPKVTYEVKPYSEQTVQGGLGCPATIAISRLSDDSIIITTDGQKNSQPFPVSNSLQGTQTFAVLNPRVFSLPDMEVVEGQLADSIPGNNLVPETLLTTALNGPPDNQNMFIHIIRETPAQDPKSFVRTNIFLHYSPNSANASNTTIELNESVSVRSRSTNNPSTDGGGNDMTAWNSCTYYQK